MNQLQNVFSYHDSQVRTIVIDGEPWFVAKDVCQILELGDVSKAVSRLDEDEKGTNSILTPGGQQQIRRKWMEGKYICQHCGFTGDLPAYFCEGCGRPLGPQAVVDATGIDN